MSFLGPTLNRPAPRGVLRVYGEGERLWLAQQDPMQELVLIQPGGAAERDWAKQEEAAATRREFEERLAECGELAYRVARGVLRNDADAEDVA